MNKVIGMQKMLWANIPLKENTGYDEPTSGKIYFADGSFGLYARKRAYSSIELPLDTRYETDACYSIEFSELPCDAAGNILLDHYELTFFKRPVEPYLGVNYCQLMLVCTKEPTHRVNLRTGVLVKNTHDSQYITNIGVSCINAEY
ncbi:hypothetical protein CBX57_006850 [Salmonella enterica]|nr:hypothetical protein [Salmonella enterica]